MNQLKEMKKKQTLTRGIIITLLALLCSCAQVFAQYKHIPEQYTRMRTRPAVMPSYGNGRGDLLMYLKDNVEYPKEHSSENEGGKVIVRFTVDREGKVRHPVIVQSASPLMDAEALRVVQDMDDWNPGRDKEGNPIRAGYYLPITFNTRRPGMVYLQPAFGLFDLTSTFGKKLKSFTLLKKVGNPFETRQTTIKGERLTIHYYYDRGDDVLNVSEDRGLYYCKVQSPRFTILDGTIQVSKECPDDLLEEKGWELLSSKFERGNRYFNKKYDVPAMHATVSIRVNAKKGTIYSFQVTVNNENHSARL